MSRALVVIGSSIDRQRIVNWAMKAPVNTRVEFKAPRRSLDQNSKLWALLTEVAQQVVWYGQKLTAEDWKDMFTASLRKARVVPGIDAGSFVLLGLHTSDMDKEEMSNLIELIHAFGADPEHLVTFHDQQEVTA